MRMAFSPNLSKSLCWSFAGASTFVASRLDAFVRGEAATTSIEYALIASFIAVTIAGICGMMFSKLSTEYTEIGNIFS